MRFESSEVESYDVFTASDLKIGDFYYSNGTTSDGGLRKLYSGGKNEKYIKQDVKPINDGRIVVGIVIKVGKDGDGDWKDDCNYYRKDGKTPMNIRGYVLALHDANGGNHCKWGSQGTPVGTNTDQATGFYGYSNTQKIIKNAADRPLDLLAAFPATYYATTDYETRESMKHASPATTSGWFLPSAGQGQYWWNYRTILLLSVQNAIGQSGYVWKSYYWSSSELDADNAWFLHLDGHVFNNYKEGSTSEYVRSILAF